MNSPVRTLLMAAVLLLVSSPAAAQSSNLALRPVESDAVARLQLGFALLAADTTSGLTTERSEALDLFSRLVRSNPDWPEAWYGLGLARAGLASSPVTAKEGPLQPSGAGFAVGAVNALARALELDSTFQPAAVALASHRAFDGWEMDARQVLASERLAILRRAGFGDSVPPDAWLGRARLESEAGSLDSAAVYLVKYLDAGGDRGTGWYRLARVRYRRADRAGAVGAYYAGAGSSESERATALYRSNIAWVADSAELAAYDSLPATEREAWLRRFWGARDAEAGRAEGERLLEHFRRYEYVLEHFAIGPSLQRRRAGRAASTLIAADAASSGGRAGGPAGGSGALSSEWDSQTVEWLAGASSFFSRFVASQQLVDHRGVLYMRHGPPDQRALSVGAGETWLYAVAPAPLIFHFAGAMFDGSSGNTTLAALPADLDAMCGLDTELCLLGMSLVTTTARGATLPRIGSAEAGPRARPLLVTEARKQVERAQQWIARGTTTDTYTPRFAEPIEPVVQLYALHGDGGARNGRLLAVFAVDGDDLLPRSAADSSGRATYPLAIRVVAFNHDGEWHELDTVRTFAAPRPLEDDEYLLGHLELPLPPGSYTVRMLVEERGEAREGEREAPGRRPAIEAERGALVGLDGVRVPSRGTALDLSDIVLGRTGSGLSWWSGRERVPLNPLNTVPRGGTVQLYYETSGLVPGAEYRTQLAVYRRGDDKRRALLTLSFAETASAEWQSIVRSLDVGRLAEGSYDLELRLQRTGGASGSVIRQVVLNVRGR